MKQERRTFPRARYGSAEWFSQRRTQEGGTVFGASEVPALMGASQFDTLADLVIKKVNPDYSSTSTPATERGHVLEPALLEYARRYYGEVVIPDVMYQRHRIVATLDGIQFNGDQPLRTIEAKTTTFYNLGSDVPLSYFWQAQAQMDAVGCDETVVVCLDRSMRLGFWEVPIDPVAVAEMREQAEKIGAKIDSGEIIDHLDEALTSKQIELLFPKPKGEKELTDEEIVAIATWRDRKEEAKRTAELEAEARDVVANILRECEVGLYQGKPVISYKRQTRKGGIDTERFLNHNPELSPLLAQYRKPDTGFRVLRLK